MSDYYVDEIEKLNYYKSRIMKELTRSGIYPDTIAVNERLDSFDEKMSLFTHRTVAEGNDFDTDQFNEEFELIAEDLKIIYKLVYDICITRYNTLKDYCESHLSELQSLAKKYQYKTKLEIDSTSLGDTVYFQASGFDITESGTTATVDLGTIEVSNGSKLACLFEGENIEPANVVFSIGDNNCSPYSLNNDLFTVPGDLAVNYYSYTIPDEEATNGSHIMNVTDLTPSQNNKYIIYAGEGQVECRGEYYEKTEGTPLSFTTGGKMIFYILDGSFIYFDFSETPLNRNFTGTSLESLSEHQKILIEYGPGFSIDFTTDGTIYATRSEGIITDGDLYYPEGIDLHDYFIEEYYTGNKTSYDVIVTISNLKEDNPLVINTIAIKETTSVEGAGES